MGLSTSTFYIDLICSANRKGKLLMETVEKWVRATAPSTQLIGLHAATKELIPYYNRYGYRRTRDACTQRVRREQSLPETNSGFWMSKCL